MGRRRAQSIADIYRVRCEQTTEYEPFIKLPDALMESLFWKVGDVIEWRKSRSSSEWVAVNLSARVLYASRFRRNLKSVNRALNNPWHPLQRVGIKRHPSTDVSVVAVPVAWAVQTLNKKTVQGLFDIYVKALETFGSVECADEWVQSPALALDGRTPLEVFGTPGGAELIHTLLHRINYGTYT